MTAPFFILYINFCNLLYFFVCLFICLKDQFDLSETRMLVNQYICEFNNLSNNIKYLSYAEEISLNNKLKIILNDFENLDVGSLEISNFFGNIYNLLSHSVDFKSGK